MSSVVPARRLKGTEENIWVELVSLASKYKTVNLGQGFPDFSPPTYIKQAFVQAIIEEGSALNQYTRAFGHPPLVNILARFFGELFGRDLDPLSNVLVTVGAYEALFCAFQALVDEGDEVILIEPFFDCYEPMVRMAGGTPIFISLRQKPSASKTMVCSRDWWLDPMELSSKFTKRTKAIVVNTPNNPLGKVFDQDELNNIAELCNKHDVLCFSDEVYEWLVYDGRKHIRIASLPGMWERTLSIGSAGKTFSATGWKVGWAFGPDHLLRHLRTVHQNSIYHCPTAAQEAVACGFQMELQRFGQHDSYFMQLPKELQRKRDRLFHCLVAAGMQPIMPEGSYFMLVDISDFKAEVPAPEDSDQPYDYFFVKWMMKNKHLAAIPGSAFYGTEHKKFFDHYIRLCFVKEDATLDAAEDILQQWRGTRKAS